jgi:hypothetical protein
MYPPVAVSMQAKSAHGRKIIGLMWTRPVAVSRSLTRPHARADDPADAKPHARHVAQAEALAEAPARALAHLPHPAGAYALSVRRTVPVFDSVINP